MLIVGLNGSPNKNGNTKYLLNHLLLETEKNGCQTQIIDVLDCVKSSKNNFCVVCSQPCSMVCFKATKLEKAFEMMARADAIVLGSPVHFGTVSAPLKAMFDMSRSLREQKKLYNKIGVGVTVGASSFGGQETTIKALHDIMLIQGMIIVGDGYGDDDCGHHGVCATKPSKCDAFALERSKSLAKRVVEVCKTQKHCGGI